MATGGLELTIEQKDLQTVSRALRREEDGKILRRDLLREIRTILTPLQTEVREAILSMESGGLEHEGTGLRQGIASKVVVQIRTGGKATGAGLKAKQTPNLRGFKMAPRYTNRQKGWRRPVYGRDVWVLQIGKPGWFDDTTKKHRDEYAAKVMVPIEDMARRIAARSS